MRLKIVDSINRMKPIKAILHPILQALSGLFPSLINAVFQTQSVSETGIVNKLGLGDAKFINSNSAAFNGTDNYYDLSDKISLVSSMATGVLEFYHTSTKDVSVYTNRNALGSVALDTSNFIAIYLGRSSTGINNETISFYHKTSGIINLNFTLNLGWNFINDGETHHVKLIIDGTNNRIEIDGIEYTDNDPELVFLTGTKTSSFFLNIPSSTLFVLGQRLIGTVSAFYSEYRLAGFKITNTDGVEVISLPFSENGTNYERVSGDVYEMLGTDNAVSATQDGYHENLVNGNSQRMLFGVNSLTGTKHSHTDKIEFSGYLTTRNSGLSVFFNSGVGTGTQGIAVATVSYQSLRLSYANGVDTEHITTALPIAIQSNAQNPFYFKYENGVFTIKVNAYTEEYAVTISSFTGDSTRNIKLNQGWYTAIFNPRLLKNGALVNLNRVPTIDNVIALDGLRVTNNQYNLAGKKQLNILDIGQSNMTGMARNTDVADNKYRYTYENVLQWKEGVWRPLGVYWIDYGSEMSLYSQLTKYVDKIIFVKLAYGGTSMWNNWNLNATNSYYLESVALMEASGTIADTIRLIQGEADTDTDAHAIAWEGYVREIVEHFRANYNPNVKVFISKLSTLVSYPASGVALLNTGVDNLVASGHCQGSFTTDDCSLQSDLHHYDYDGYNLLGDKFLASIVSAYGLSLLAKGSYKNEIIEAETDVDYTNGGLNTWCDPNLNNWNRKDDPQPASTGSTFFYAKEYDAINNVTGSKDHIIYSEPPTAEERAKTVKALNWED